MRAIEQSAKAGEHRPAPPIQADIPGEPDGYNERYHAGALIAITAVIDRCLDITAGGLEASSQVDLPTVEHVHDRLKELANRLASASRDHGCAQAEHRMERVLEDRRTELVRRLLGEERVESAELAGLDYEFRTSSHLGLVVSGVRKEVLLRRARAHSACQVLQVRPDDETVWVWLGVSQGREVPDVERLLSVARVTDVSVAIGETRPGLDGWRQTHREARAAFLRARREPKTLVRYSDRPLITTALENDTLATWLKAFLRPLLDHPDGQSLRLTMRAYIDADCSCTSAAHRLGVRRHTVRDRVRVAENLLGRDMRSCLPELDVALRLFELTSRDAAGVG